MTNDTISTATVKMRYIEAFAKANAIKAEVKFWVKEKAAALEANDGDRIIDAILELKRSDRELAYAELDMMYYFDILEMRK